MNLLPPPGLGLAAEDCSGCHAAEVEQWRGSRHGTAATNPVFRAAWEHWPNGWCLGCHAPEASGQVALIGAFAVPGQLRAPLAEPQDGTWQEGVSCAVCHVQDGAIISRNPASDAASAAHPVVVREDFGGPAFCARCHEFNFQLHTPAGPFAYGDNPSQETVTEWSRSRAAREGSECVTCHMPDGAHTFPGSHTPSLVRSAVSAEAIRTRAGVTVTLTAAAAHRIPTGDPFRRLEIRACADEACTQVIARGLARRKISVDDVSWHVSEDSTIPPTRGEVSQRRIKVEAPSARAWQLWYMYGDRRFERYLPADEVGFMITGGVFGP